MRYLMWLMSCVADLAMILAIYLVCNEPTPLAMKLVIGACTIHWIRVFKFECWRPSKVKEDLARLKGMGL